MFNGKSSTSPKGEVFCPFTLMITTEDFLGILSPSLSNKLFETILPAAPLSTMIGKVFPLILALQYIAVDRISAFNCSVCGAFFVLLACGVCKLLDNSDLSFGTAWNNCPNVISAFCFLISVTTEYG